jgi:sporulenol synthase
MIIVLRILEFDEEEVIQKLTSRLLALQQANSSWGLFEDDKGNLSTTVEAYTLYLFLAMLKHPMKT